MNKTVTIICLLITAIGCNKTSNDDIFSTVTLVAHCDEAKLISIRVDNTVKGNYFQNLNNGLKYDFPYFTNGKCTIKVLKGVYIVAFDGEAILEDGRTRKVRCYEHRSPNDSINILEGQAELTFNLMLL